MFVFLEQTFDGSVYILTWGDEEYLQILFVQKYKILRNLRQFGTGASRPLSGTGL